MALSFELRVVDPSSDAVLLAAASAPTVADLWDAVNAALADLSPGGYEIVWSVESPGGGARIAQIRLAVNQT